MALSAIAVHVLPVSQSCAAVDAQLLGKITSSDVLQIRAVDNVVWARSLASIQAYDTSNPAQPSPTVSFWSDLSADKFLFDATGNYIVATGRGSDSAGLFVPRLRCFDISSVPETPFIVFDKQLYPPDIGIPAQLKCVGDRIFFLQNVKSSSPTTVDLRMFSTMDFELNEEASLNLGMNSGVFDASDRLVAVLSGNSLLSLYDPNTGLALKSTLNLSQAALSVCIDESTVFLSYRINSTELAYVIDSTDITKPKLLGSIPNPGIVQGKLGFRLTSGTLQITDLSDPLKPTNAATLWMQDKSDQLVVTANRAYCSDGSHVNIVGFGRSSAEAAQLDIGVYAGLSIRGTIGKAYRLESCDRLGSGPWTVLDTVTLGRSPQIWVDLTSPATEKRLYRATAVP